MKTSMSGQNLSLKQKLRDNLSLFKVHLKKGFSIEKHVEGFETLVETYKEYTSEDIFKKRVLEIGIGQRATITILMSSFDVKITGIDMEFPTYKMLPNIFFKVVRTNGFERACKSFIRHILFDKKFLNDLSQYLQSRGENLKLAGIDIRQMNARSIEFPDETFDFIYSLDAFEHIFKEDINKVLSEIARVTKGAGVVFIKTTVFGGITSGHRMEWRNPSISIRRKSPPWDHLRKNLFPVNTYLNGFRIEDFRKLFKKYFEIVHEEFSEPVGNQYLTPEIMEELSDFSKEELLTNDMTIIARKKKKINQ